MNAEELLSSTELWCAIAGLLAGPLLIHVLPRVPAIPRIIDGYILVTIGGLALLHLLPETLAEGGLWAVLAAVLGLAGPLILEKRMHAAQWTTLLVGLLGLGVHNAIDGAALASAAHKHDHDLAFALILHRLPAGLLVFSAISSIKGPRVAWSFIGILVIMTMGGFGLSEFVNMTSSPRMVAVIQAFVVGALLHVVTHTSTHQFGHHHDGHECDTHQSHPHAHGPVHSACNHHHTNEFHRDVMPTSAEHDKHSHPPVDDLEFHSQCEHGHPIHDHPSADPETTPTTTPHPSSSILDVLHDHSKPLAWRLQELAGAAAGILTMFVLLRNDHIVARVPESVAAGQTFMVLALESAPALLLAYVIAGFVKVLLAPSAIRWMNRGPRIIQATRGMIFGLPIPICSCGVLPVYEALIKKGVAPTAGLAFLIATPELGIDALLLSIPLLGGELTIARLTAAMIVAITVAYWIGRLIPEPPPMAADIELERATLPNRMRQGLAYGLVDLVDHTLPWIILGLGIAALLEPLLSPSTVSHLPSWFQVPAFALLGIPLYVCASGATPLAAVAIHKGVSAGAALAFLLTGPATNATTFGILKALHGRKTALLFGAGVCVASCILGWTVDWVFATEGLRLHESAEETASTFQWASLVALALIGLTSLVRQGPRQFVDQVIHPIHSH